MPRGRGERLLTLAGAASLAIAVLHLVIILIGAPAYRYFGAGEKMADLAAQGSIYPAAVTLAIAGIFVVFGLYALAGAGRIGRLPLLRAGLVAISTIYLLRGLVAIPETAALVLEPRERTFRYFIFSQSALFIGVSHALGTWLAWNRLRGARKKQ